MVGKKNVIKNDPVAECIALFCLITGDSDVTVVLVSISDNIPNRFFRVLIFVDVIVVREFLRVVLAVVTGLLTVVVVVGFFVVVLVVDFFVVVVVVTGFFVVVVLFVSLLVVVVCFVVTVGLLVS